jgi:uncharacterized membrane protein
MVSEINRPQERFNWFKMFWTGFTNMSRLSKTLWIVAVVKLIIMFFILKPFFFPNVLNTKYEDDADKAQHVRTELFKKAPVTE